MQEHYYAGQTLIGQLAFAWTRQSSGMITVYDKPAGSVMSEISARQYAELLDLLLSRPEGVCLDVLSNVEPMPDYLGWLFNSFGIPRSHASWLVAIAVEEGYVELEQRGSGFSDYWLIPAVECSVRTPSGLAPLKSGESDRVDSDLDYTLQSSTMRSAGNDVASDLRELAAQVELVGNMEEYRAEIALEDLQTEKKIVSLVADIMEWERGTWAAYCIYSIAVADKELSHRCLEASARARTRNTGQRRFSHANGAHLGSPCLYVGGNRTLSSRIQQHLGLSHPGVCSMQMSYWLAEHGLEGNLCLRASRFPSDTDHRVLRALEEHSWRTARPLFGRMGGR